MCYNVIGDKMIKGKSKSFELKICTKFKDRLLGNCFKKKINKILCFSKCNSIHTFFMKCNIDVVMLDKNKTVKYIFSNVKPWRIILPKKKVYYVLELPSGENIYKVNDILKF